MQNSVSYSIVSASFSNPDCGTYVSYGIKMCTDGTNETVVHDITTSREDIALLVERMNRGQLSPMHFNDVIEDFLATLSF